jgi:hypothetical protein
MIDKVADNKTNLEDLKLNPTEKIKEKLDYYRTLFNKTHDLSTHEFESLKQDISTFFNLKPVGFTTDPPQRLVRITNNNRILKAQGKELGYLTDISQLLAPPTKYCDFARCNIPGQQVLYCAVDLASAYWETRPKNGDVITISHFELRPNTKVNCNIIRTEKRENPVITHQLHEVHLLLEEFFVDVYSLEVSRERPKDYLFSGLLSSEQLFYPVVSDKNIEAIIFPSVQKKKNGKNFAIRNELIFEKYKLLGVETRFILDEYENLDPTTDNLTTDNLIGSFGTKTFDFKNGKILYDKKADEMFQFFRQLQTSGGKQTRYDSRTLAFDFSLKGTQINATSSLRKYGRNDKVTVVYQNGDRKENIKHKHIEDDIRAGRCKIIEF